MDRWPKTGNGEYAAPKLSRVKGGGRMSTPLSLSYAILGGPSRMDLMLALFDRERPEPLKFIGSDNGRMVNISVWLNGLIQSGENSWNIVGTLTANTPHNPSRGIGPSPKVVCSYNDHTRVGSLTVDGTEEME